MNTTAWLAENAAQIAACLEGLDIDVEMELRPVDGPTVCSWCWLEPSTARFDGELGMHHHCIEDCREDIRRTEQRHRLRGTLTIRA